MTVTDTQAPTYLRVHTRWMIIRDLPEVLQIEADSFEPAWGYDDFLRVLRQRNCIGHVAELGEQVVGFMVYELLEKQLVLLNFAVSPAHRRLGVGTQMASHVIDKLSSNRRTAITVLVRESALPAQLFFRAQGFLATDVLRGFYPDAGAGREDAYELEYRLGTERIF